MKLMIEKGTRDGISQANKGMLKRIINIWKITIKTLSHYI